jgi:hypothetical protein
VHEQNGKVGRRIVRLDRDDAVHVEVAARLEHQQPAIAVEILPRMAPLGQDGRAGIGG